jgi:hypothetical protein
VDTITHGLQGGAVASTAPLAMSASSACSLLRSGVGSGLG